MGAYEGAGEVVEAEGAVGGGGDQERAVERCAKSLDRHEQDVRLRDADGGNHTGHRGIWLVSSRAPSHGKGTTNAEP